MANNINSNIEAHKMYFSCLNIYDFSITADLKEVSHNDTDYMKLARSVDSLLLIRYKILKVLDANQFGFTYLVERINKDTKYIIKEFFPQKYVKRNDKEEMLLRIPLEIEELIEFNHMKTFFIGEAENLKKIAQTPHANIAKIDRVEEHKNNTTYIVYEYETGITLQKYIDNKILKKEKFSHREVLKLLNPLLDAVEHLHRLDIYHLNITPDNILIRDDDSLMLMGLEGSTLFKDGDSGIVCSAYTLRYAAPEQVALKHISQIDNGTDMYAIGTLFYRIITGEYPLDVNERIVCKSKHEEYDPYVFLQKKNELLETYDRQLLSSIDKALMFSSKDRFSNIAGFKAALQGNSKLLKKHTSSNKRKFFLYGVLGLLFFFVVVMGWYYVTTNKEKNAIDLDTIQENMDSSIVHDKNQEKVSEDVEKELDRTLDRNNKFENTIPQSDETNEVANQEKVSEEVDKVLNSTDEEDNELKNTILPSDEMDEVVNEEKVSEDAKKELYSTLDERKEGETSTQSNEVIHEIVSTEQVSKNTEDVIDTARTIKQEKIHSTQAIVEKVSNEIEQRIQTKELADDMTDDSEKIGQKSLVYPLPNDTVSNITVDNTEDIKTNKKVKKSIKVRKKRKLHIRKIKKKVQRKPMNKRNPLEKHSAGYVWYCKAYSGTIKTSARHSNKNQSKRAALNQCRRKVGKTNSCRVLNCFLIR